MRQTVRYHRPVGSTRSGASEIAVTIEGYAMPGRSCAPADVDGEYENVHVGVQRRQEVVDLVGGDAPDARWTFAVTTRVADDGTVDFTGPYVRA